MERLLSNDLLQEIGTWLADPRDEAHWAATSHRFRKALPRPLPLQLVTSCLRFPHQFFLQEAASGRVLSRQVSEWDDEQSYRLFVYVERLGQRVYLEPCFQQKGGEKDEVCLGLAMQYATPVDSTSARTRQPACLWQLERRAQQDSQLQQQNQSCWMTLSARNVPGFPPQQRFVLDLQSASSEPYLRRCHDENQPPKGLYRLEEFNGQASLLRGRDGDDDWSTTTTSAVPRVEWSRRLWQRLPLQPVPVVNDWKVQIFAPDSFCPVGASRYHVGSKLHSDRSSVAAYATMTLMPTSLLVQATHRSVAMLLPRPPATTTVTQVLGTYQTQSTPQWRTLVQYAQSPLSDDEHKASRPLAAQGLSPQGEAGWCFVFDRHEEYKRLEL